MKVVTVQHNYITLTTPALFLATGVNYGDAVILTAIQFENACNPVLRANAQATIER